MKGPVSGGLIITLMFVHLLASMLVAEIRNLRAAVWTLIVQSFTLSLIILAFGWGQIWMFIWFIWAIFTKVFFLPWLFFRYMRMFPQKEEEPVIGTWLSLTLVVLFVLAIYQLLHTYISMLVPTISAASEPTKSSLSMAFTVFLLGAYVCMVRRDLVKVIIGVLLLENGAHLALISLVPGRWETAVMGIVTNVVISAWLLLYFGGVIFQALGTTDTLKLSELRR